MAPNQTFRESVELSLPVGTGIKSGDPVRLGIINGVALTDSGDMVGTGTSPNQRSFINTSNASGYATVWSHGVWQFTVTLAAARTAGHPIYCTVPGANKKATLTDDATGAKLFGFLAYDEPTSGALVRNVAIVPTVV